MSDIEKKDYERYLEQDTETWGEFFRNMNLYWKGFMAEIRGDIDEAMAQINEVTEDLEDYTDDPEIMEMAVAAGRLKTVARVSESTMNAIGKCLGAAASLLDND